jgi:hypothetical protein
MACVWQPDDISRFGHCFKTKTSRRQPHSQPVLLTAKVLSTRGRTTVCGASTSLATTISSCYIEGKLGKATSRRTKSCTSKATANLFANLGHRLRKPALIRMPPAWLRTWPRCRLTRWERKCTSTPPTRVLVEFIDGSSTCRDNQRLGIGAKASTSSEWGDALDRFCVVVRPNGKA